jgi:hypothetical protein
MILAVASLTLAFSVGGCKKKQDQTGYNQGYGYGQQPGYGGQPGYGQTGGQPGYGQTTNQPAPTTSTGGAAPAGQPAPCQEVDAAAAAPAQPIITSLASSSVPPGAKPVGAVMACMFQQGQQLSRQVTMQPGKCYTVVGAGAGVTELDLQIVAVTPIPGMAPVLAQDQETGPQAVVGKNPNCYKWALPMPGTVAVVMTATAGAGLAAAQVFEK